MKLEDRSSNAGCRRGCHAARCGLDTRTRTGLVLWSRAPLGCRFLSSTLRQLSPSSDRHPVPIHNTPTTTPEFDMEGMLTRPGKNEAEDGKMVNGSRYYWTLESVSIASALSSALTIYRWSNADSLKLQLLTTRGRRSGGRPQRTVYYVNTMIHTTLAGIESTTFRLLVRRDTSRATETEADRTLWGRGGHWYRMSYKNTSLNACAPTPRNYMHPVWQSLTTMPVH